MENTKNCPNCNEQMYYDGYYHCFECGECGKTYNYALQELRPKEEWQGYMDEEDY